MADKKKGGAQVGQSKGNPPAHKRDDRDGSAAKGANRGPRRDKPEMDEATKHIPKVTKPNRDAFADEVKAFDDKIQHLTNQLKDVQTRINTANRDKGALYAKKEEIFAQLKGIGAIVAQAKDNRKKFVNEIKSLSEIRTRKLEELQKLKEKLPPKLIRGEGRGFNLKATLDDIDLKIGKLENKLKVSTLTLAEEKAVVAKISSLLNAKKVAKEYDQEWQKIRGTLDSDNQPSQEKRGHLSAMIKEQEDKIAEVRGTEEKLQKELEDVRNKLKQVTDSIPGLLEKREQLRQEKDQTFTARGEVFKKKNEAEAQFKEYMVKVNEVRAEEWKKNQEKRAVERAQRAEEDLKNQLNAIPFEEERSTCDVLIAYLQQYLIKPEEEEEHVENNNTTTASPATPEGAVVLKRDEVEQFAPMKAKAKKQKKPKAPALKPDSLLKHDLAVLRQFEILSLACPLKAADVPKSIEDINQKKEHFTKLGVEKKKQLEADYARKQEEKAKEAQKQADAQKVESDPKSDPDHPETTAITNTQEALSTEVQS